MTPSSTTENKLMEKLKFLLFSSMIDSTFWYSLSRLKLEHLRLDDAPLELFATFHAELNSSLPALASLNYETLQHIASDKNHQQQQQSSSNNNSEHRLYGQLKLFNTLAEFSASDKKELIADAGRAIWESITNEERQSEVDGDLERHLSRFLMIAFADLKRYAYHYWCAFPALNFPAVCSEDVSLNSGETLRDHFTDVQVASLLRQYGQLPSTDKLFFAVIVTLNDDQKTEEVHVKGFREFWSTTVYSLTSANFKVVEQV